MVWTSTHDNITFFTQSKSMNKHLKFGRCFVGHSVLGNIMNKNISQYVKHEERAGTGLIQNVDA
jgi:hypothetical protein